MQIFERETNREKNLEKAMKEAKIKARKEAAKGGDAALDAELPPAELEKVGFSSRASTEWQFVRLISLKNFPTSQWLDVQGGSNAAPDGYLAQAGL